MRASSILIVDDEPDIRALCADALAGDGYAVASAASAREALVALAAAPREIVLSDLSMPEMSGLELLAEIRENFRRTDVILMTGYATVESAVAALRLGAYDYVRKPFSIDELITRVARLAERKEMSAENRLLRDQLRTGRGPGGMIGASPVMLDLYRLILKIAQRPQAVLISGESGSGKELVARAIHECGPRAGDPFVAVDCAALSPALIESELFGHTHGAFTGASQRRVGLLAAAKRGTVFFDEVGELPLEMQAKLLRTIQQREIRPVGANQPQPFEARIVAATHRDLEAAVKDGTFRQDLYFRLNVLPVRVPPLRDRSEDIAALALAFVDQERGPGNPVAGISRTALDLLARHSWPGNVRELRNHVERAIAVSDGPRIEPRDLAPEVRDSVPSAGAAIGKLETVERKAISEALESTRGHRVRAAKVLGIGKTTLYKKLKDYQLR
ncbi:MAG: sigma-54 dependent transcriptional regulator [Acidobacteriia bacterium]|nr:sigma-54 dependent transcriptional regulator [Terriglobia bacterium]